MVALVKMLRSSLTVTASVTALIVPALAAAGVVLEPSAQVIVEQRYDDDVRTLAMDRAVLGPSGQLMSRLTPQLGLNLRDPTLTVESTYALDVTYRHGSGRTTFDHRGQFTLDKRLTDRLAVDSELRVWRVSDPTSLPRLGMAPAFSPVLFGRFDAGASYRATRRLTLRPLYRFEGAHIEEDPLGATAGVAARGSGYSHSPAIEGWFRLDGRAEVGADYRLQYFVFMPREGLGNELAHSHGISAAFRYRLFKRVGLTARAGPTAFARGGLGAGGYTLVPRLQLDLHRDGEFFDLSLSAGHDLVGASGFTSAVWADYASVMGAWRFWRPLRLFAAASFFRNGTAPQVGWTELGTARVPTGYSVGGGAEWEAMRNLSFLLSVTRHAQLGFLDRMDPAAQLELNIVSLRLNFRAF